MKILFVSPAMEEKSRGIGAIFRAMVESAKQQGHEVYIVTGHPHSSDRPNSPQEAAELEHEHAQLYVDRGRDGFGYMIRRKFGRKSILLGLMSGMVLKHRTIKTDTRLLGGEKSVLNFSDYMVKSPYFYLLLNFGKESLSQFLLNRLVKANNIDLVVVSAPTMLKSSKTRAKLAHFVHDTMPFELEEAPQDNDTPRRYKKQFQSTCHNSDILLTNSRDTASKISTENPDANVQVLYGTSSSQRKDVGQSDIMKRKKLEPKKFLLFVSTLEKRKNVGRLLEAYSKIHSKLGMPMVVVGAQGYGYDEIHATYKDLPKAVRADIHFFGYVNEAEKFELFDNAFAFVFPSVYEGMGLMLIEAMQANLPVVSSSRGALAEAGGDAALYIEDPYDVDQIADAIMELYDNPELAKEMVEKGKEQRKMFTFEKFAQRFKTAMESIE